MTASAVPLSNGCPDQGAEGHRFMGITLVRPAGRMGFVACRQAVRMLRSGLATEWKNDPANQKRWIFTLRQGVKFHNGKVMDADDVVFSYDRAFKTDAPWFDARASAQVRGRMPTAGGMGRPTARTRFLDGNLGRSTARCPSCQHLDRHHPPRCVGSRRQGLGRLSQQGRRHRAVEAAAASTCGKVPCCCGTPITGKPRACRNARS